MAKYLATFNDTLDDIEITGFMVMTEREVELFEELASSITWSFVYRIGDNELEFTSGEDLLTRIDFREISNEEHKILKKVFESKFGTFIDEEFLTQIAVDETEEEIDSDDDDDDYRNRNNEDYDDYN